MQMTPRPAREGFGRLLDRTGTETRTGNQELADPCYPQLVIPIALSDHGRFTADVTVAAV